MDEVRLLATADYVGMQDHVIPVCVSAMRNPCRFELLHALHTPVDFAESCEVLFDLANNLLRIVAVEANSERSCDCHGRRAYHAGAPT